MKYVGHLSLTETISEKGRNQLEFGLIDKRRIFVIDVY